MRERTFADDNLALVESLKTLDKFKLFGNEEIASFVEAGRFREYEPGDVVIREGEYDCWVYFMINGKLEISNKGTVVGYLQRNGDMFGEMGVIDASPRSATIKAISKTLTLSFDASVIDQKLKSNDLRFCYMLYRIFAEVLAVRLRETTRENTQLHHALSKMGAI